MQQDKWNNIISAYFQILQNGIECSPEPLNVLIKETNNAQFQDILNRNINISQYLMGIGSGAHVKDSGEYAVLDKLKSINRNKEKKLFVFDVGANEGQFLHQILNKLNNLDYCIHSFEPSEDAFNLLHDKFKYKSNIIFNKFGLSNYIGEANLFYDKKGSGLASLTKRRLDHFGINFNNFEKVKIDTLDNYCTDKKIKYIDLLKLDVEGHELDVLKGATRMFQEQRICMVSFEFGGCNIDTHTYFQDFWYFFMSNRMNNFFRITPSGYLHRLTNYSETYEQFRTTNFLVTQ